MFAGISTLSTPRCRGFAAPWGQKAAFCLALLLALSVGPSRRAQAGTGAEADGVSAPEHAAVLGLDEAVAITLRLLPAIASSAAGRDAAYARITQARSAWLPSLTGSFAYSRQTANFVLRPGNLPSSLTGASSATRSRGASFNYWNAQLQLTQTLLDFGAAAYGISSSRALARQSDASVRQAILEATLATRKSYFTAQGTQRLAQVARLTLANQERHKEQIRGQVQVGQRPPIDLAQAETDLSQARVSLITAENNDATACAALAQAMGVEGTDRPFAVGDDTLSPLADEDAPLHLLLAEALAHRPEMHGLHEAAYAQAQKLRGLVATFLPQVSAAGSFTDAGKDIGALGWNWNAGVNLSWPLLAGGLNVGQVREAQALLRQAQANVGTTRNAIRLELTSALLAVRAGTESLAAASNAVTNAAYQLSLAEGRYTTGLGSVIELSDAQLAWATANSQKVQAQTALGSARAALIKAMGRST